LAKVGSRPLMIMLKAMAKDAIAIFMLGGGGVTCAYAYAI